jgi:hypothetical protein
MTEAPDYQPGQRAVFREYMSRREYIRSCLWFDWRWCLLIAATFFGVVWLTLFAFFPAWLDKSAPGLALILSLVFGGLLRMTNTANLEDMLTQYYPEDPRLAWVEKPNEKLLRKVESLYPGGGPLICTLKDRYYRYARVGVIELVGVFCFGLLIASIEGAVPVPWWIPVLIIIAVMITTWAISLPWKYSPMSFDARILRDDILPPAAISFWQPDPDTFNLEKIARVNAGKNFFGMLIGRLRGVGKTFGPVEITETSGDKHTFNWVPNHRWWARRLEAAVYAKRDEMERLENLQTKLQADATRLQADANDLLSRTLEETKAQRRGRRFRIQRGGSGSATD